MKNVSFGKLLYLFIKKKTSTNSNASLYEEWKFTFSYKKIPDIHLYDQIYDNKKNCQNSVSS